MFLFSFDPLAVTSALDLKTTSREFIGYATIKATRVKYLGRAGDIHLSTYYHYA